MPIVNRQPHISVLRNEAVELLNVKEGGRYVDGTLGAGGHAEWILSQNPSVELIGIDRDEQAVAYAAKRLASFGKRAHIEHGLFTDLKMVMDRVGWTAVDGILLDLGISSLQLDDEARGFSYRSDGPLDMRMDQRQGMTASDLLEALTTEELAAVLREFGEVRQARMLARAIKEEGRNQRWERTRDLAALIQKTLRLPSHRRDKPLACCFQALRIAVNEELAQLDSILRTAVDCLATERRLVLISFHSLEDRRVKQFFRQEAATCVCPPAAPICTCNKTARLRVVTKKAVVPGEDECRANPRSSSAKLRAAEKV